jgi:hypothetical protein
MTVKIGAMVDTVGEAVSGRLGLERTLFSPVSDAMMIEARRREEMYLM